MSKNLLFIIPARGGSKGILKKNIKPLNSVPLVFYSIDLARKFTDDKNICVSTDDQEIIETIKQGRNLHMPFIRPQNLATDTAGTYEVLIHALDHYAALGSRYDGIVLLQPTSPLRTEANVSEAIDLYLKSDIDMVVSVKNSKANPYYNIFEENDEGLLKKSKEGNYSRRQDCPDVYEYNGAIYIIKVESLLKSKLNELKKIKKYVMSEENSIDIDSTLDWQMAELILKNQNNQFQ